MQDEPTGAAVEEEELSPSSGLTGSTTVSDTPRRVRRLIPEKKHTTVH
jgi:hypothetical protein